MVLTLAILYDFVAILALAAIFLLKLGGALFCSKGEGSPPTLWVSQGRDLGRGKVFFLERFRGYQSWKSFSGKK